MASWEGFKVFFKKNGSYVEVDDTNSFPVKVDANVDLDFEASDLANAIDYAMRATPLEVDTGVVLPPNPWCVNVTGANTDAIKAATSDGSYHVVTGIVCSSEANETVYFQIIEGASTARFAYTTRGYAGVATSPAREITTVVIKFPTPIVIAVDTAVRCDVTGGTGTSSSVFTNMFGYTVSP